MAAKAKSTLSSASSYKPKAKKRNKGVHAKTKMSRAKGSSNYVKVSVGQG